MVNLNIHNKCNQFCVFCNTQKLLKDKVWKETTKEEIIKQLEVAAKKEKKVNFTGGGEVTMLKDLPELIKYAKSIGIEEVCLETNAVLFSYDDYVKKLKECGLDHCVVSLHSHKESVSDWITQTPGSFRHTIEGLKNLQKEKIKVQCILHTINKLNYKDLKNFIRFIRKNFNEIDSFGLSFIRPIEGFKKSQSATPRLTDIRKYLHDALDFCRKHSIKVVVSVGLGVPLCFMQGYEEYSMEFLTFLRRGKKEHKKQSYQYEKTKGKQCEKCSLNACCSGVHNNYAVLYGTDELEPLNTSLAELEKNINKKCR